MVRLRFVVVVVGECIQYLCRQFILAMPRVLIVIHLEMHGVLSVFSVSEHGFAFAVMGVDG